MYFFENSLLHFLKTCYNGLELASVLISFLIIHCRESQYNGLNTSEWELEDLGCLFDLLC